MTRFAFCHDAPGTGLRISHADFKKTEYALRALFAIARSPQTELHQIHDLSRREKIPVKFLEQILLTLRNAGILTSKRGVGGGYGLQRPASQIMVGEVIRLMDGPLAPVPCASPHPTEPCTCPDPNTCPLRALMTRVRNDLDRLLEQKSVAEALSDASSQRGNFFDI